MHFYEGLQCSLLKNAIYQFLTIVLRINDFHKYPTTFGLLVLKVQRTLVRSSPRCIENKQKGSQNEEQKNL
jgi:hypothetical protein